MTDYKTTDKIGGEVRENKLGYMPEGKLLFSMSAPIMLSMLVLACYNVVDSFFVARIGEDALSAVSLAFPLQTLQIAITTGTGVGLTALISKRLGERNLPEVDRIATNGAFLYALTYIAFLLTGIFVVKPFYHTQIASGPIAEEGIRYLSICMCLSVGVAFSIFFQRLLLSTGKSIYTMFGMVAGGVTNIILDPIMIFGLFGMPKMGVAGAAIATVIGQFVEFAIVFYFHHRCNHEVNVRLKGFRPELKIISMIYKIGIPSMIMVAIGSVMVYGFNKILLVFTTTATAVFGVYFKLQSFIFMPVFGMNNGMIPIIAFNYGARQPKRIARTVKIAVTAAVTVMIIGFFVLQFFSGKILQIFNASENMLAIGVPAFRIISVSFLLAGVCVVLSSGLQAMGNAFDSMMVSLIRQLIVLLPAAYILSKAFGFMAVWWSYPIAEVASFAATLFFVRRLYRNKILPLYKTPQG